MKKITLLILLSLQTLTNFLTHGTLFSQWYKQSMPVNKPVTGIKFIDTLRGWACTGDFLDTSQSNAGCILHTSNGGTNWSIQFSRAPFAFSAMTMVNNLIGYAAGDSLSSLVGKVFLYKTTNGGINWTSIAIPNNMFVSNFYFLSSDTGWEVSSAGAGPDTRITTDGGYTWQVRTNGMTSTTRAIFFLNYNTGYCGANGYLYKTNNAGLSWNQMYNFNTSQINSIFFMNQNTGWLGLSPDTSDKVAFTTNGGINWIIQNIGSPYGFNILDIFFFDSNLGYACTGFSKICKTIFGGFPWGYQNDSTGTYRMSFTDSLHGWTGSFGISHTSNGGGPIFYVGIINNHKQIPQKFVLYQNFPNPFNSQTTIRFSIKKSSYVKLKIYDVLGHEKSIWESNKMLETGTHELSFNAGDFASGVYFYELTVSDAIENTVFRDTKKMVLVK